MSGQFSAFVYGTLMAPEVLFTVIYGDRDPPQAFRDLHTFSAARLEGYVRHRVRHEDYPGIISEDGGLVLGVYVTGLTDANMQKLDFFEGPEYDKKSVKVKLVDSGEEREADTYVFNDPSSLEIGEWDFEHFRNEKMRYWSRGSFQPSPSDEARIAANLGTEVSNGRK